MLTGGVCSHDIIKHANTRTQGSDVAHELVGSCLVCLSTLKVAMSFSISLVGVIISSSMLMHFEFPLRGSGSLHEYSIRVEDKQLRQHNLFYVEHRELLFYATYLSHCSFCNALLHFFYKEIDNTLLILDLY